LSKDFIRRRSSRVSKAEIEIMQELQKHSLHFMTQQEFCLQSTTPDFFFPDVNMAVYLDGEQVHRNKEERDMELRRLLKKRHGCKVRSYTYKAPITKAKLEEIVGSIIDNVKGYRRDMK